PKARLHHNQSRDRGPVGLGHLDEPRDYDRDCRSDCCANGVRDRRKVLLVPDPEFHANMIFPANQVWQDSFDRLRHADPHTKASLTLFPSVYFCPFMAYHSEDSTSRMRVGRDRLEAYLPTNAAASLERGS